jgi:hypothetical protein
MSSMLGSAAPSMAMVQPSQLAPVIQITYSPFRGSVREEILPVLSLVSRYIVSLASS